MSATATSSSHSTGIGFTGALFLVFLVLKLTGVINWSWWAVTAPLWGSAALVVLVLLAAGVVALIAAAFKK